MKNKLVAIGDSFVTEQIQSNYYKDKYVDTFWCDIISKKCDNINVYYNGDSSRDIQTIIDIWIKTIPHLSKYDNLVIIIPSFNRTRLPLDDEFWYNHFDCDELNIIDRFYGTDSYHKDKKLEFWGDVLPNEYFKEKLSIQEIINASKSSQLNYIEIIESLKLLSPKNTHIMSWDNMDYKSVDIDDKKDLIKKIGVWETLNDDFKMSNGEIGTDDDLHWGIINMQRIVADYIIKKFNLNKNIQ